MRLAYVLPRYGPQVLGGAEMLARSAIQQLAARGHEIEVWTTCVGNLYTRVNEYPAGVEHDAGITVRRFEMEVNRPFNLMIEPLSRETEYFWLRNLSHSPRLYTHIAENGTAFDALIFTPYLAGVTFHGASIHPDKSIIWPCLHDELFAYLASTRRLLACARGLIFNTNSEADFVAKKLRIHHPRRVVVGMGFDAAAGDAAAFRRRYPSLDDPFFLYMGRLDESKNVGLLIRYFMEYEARHPGKLRLALLGDGPLRDKSVPGVVPLGFVDEATKRDALAAVAFLCQPSLYESFSIVLMEAWAQRKPVLVHEGCAVTLDHVRRAQGGLYFADYSDFEGAVDYLLGQPAQAARMGANGYEYVRRNYNWRILTDRLELALESWLEQAP
jgi:glycosyltransferase involved in cell wall biosynthesis